MWIEDEALAGWHLTELTGRRGRQRFYNDLAIECALTVRGLFHLPLRQTQEFLEGLFMLIKLPLTVPNYLLGKDE